MKKFLISVWDPARGNVKFFAWAGSYDQAVSLYVSKYPPSVIWTISPENKDQDLRQSESKVVAI